jgi:hypothetical protein
LRDRDFSLSRLDSYSTYTSTSLRLYYRLSILVVRTLKVGCWMRAKNDTKFAMYDDDNEPNKRYQTTGTGGTSSDSTRTIGIILYRYCSGERANKKKDTKVPVPALSTTDREGPLLGVESIDYPSEGYTLYTTKHLCSSSFHSRLEEYR